jgi:hypothetical protein
MLLKGLLAAETDFGHRDKVDRDRLQPEEKNIKPVSVNTVARVMAGAAWYHKNEEGVTNRISAGVGTVS